MRRSTHARTLAVTIALAVIGGLGATPAAQAQGPATSVQAADELAGDITFSVPSGTFQQEVTVSLSTEVAGAEIRYTTNGQPPDASSPVYDGTPLRFTSSTQLRAQPFAGGAPAGDPGTALYLAQLVSTEHDLPVLLIDSYGQGRPDREYLDSATMLFEPAGGTTTLAATPTLATRAGFHLRGQSSSTFDKTPYRIEFRDNNDDDADYPGLGMPADSDWVLRGPFTDKALIREAFVYQLGREMGLAAPRFEFVEFYLNPDAGAVTSDDYMGVYMIVETIKNRSHRLDLKRLRGDRPEDRTLPRITGGYIWKFDWLAAEEPILPCQGPAATCWNYLELVDPHPENHLQPEQRDWITNHLQEFNDMLHGPGFADPETGYRAWIDVPSFVDHLIINELSREMDSYVRSAYFYKDRGEKITAGPLWDYDLTFGVGGFFENTQTAGWQHQQTRQPTANNWFPRLLEDPAFVEEVRRRWQELRGGLLSDTQMQARIAALTAPLDNAARRNFQRWPNLTNPQVGFFTTPTAPTWQGQVQVMRDWLLARAAWLDSPAGWNVSGPTTPPPPNPNPAPAPGGCTATYRVTSEWTGGFQADVRVTAGPAPLSGWTVSWAFADGQSISQAWGAVVSGGPSMTARNETWNGPLAAGASTGFGFIGTWNGTNGVPAVTCSAS